MWEYCLDEFGMRNEEWVQIFGSKNIRKGQVWCFESVQHIGINKQIHLVALRQRLTPVQPRSAAEKVVPELADRYWKGFSVMGGQGIR